MFRSPHLATIAANFWPRRLDWRRFPVRAVRYQTEPDVSVLVHEQSPEGAPRGEVVLLHGLEGSSEGGYMRSMAQAALEAGFAVHRVNTRGCGGTESWCRTLYHAGLTSDPVHILGELRRQGRGPVYLAGFSLGGNVALKLAGELGAGARSLAAGVCAISAPVDLAACVRRLDHPENFLYQWRFVRSMKRRMRVRHKLMPELFPVDGLDRIRTVYAMDDRMTAPFFGFGTADNYYATQSSRQFLDRIGIPALLIASKDDPLVPFEVYRRRYGVNVTLLATEHGGHVGFLSRRRPRFWLDGTILTWLDRIGNKQEAVLV